MQEIKEGVRVEAEVTADGSLTLYRADIDEHYHSVKGALAESLHVYIETGLKHFAEQHPGKDVRVFEVGFGTGLNAALAAEFADGGVNIHYVSYELYPLGEEVTSHLDYGSHGGWLEGVNGAEWNRPVRVSDTFTLEKVEADFLKVAPPQGIDVVFFDAFAPEKQPEMWEPERIAAIHERMTPGGVFVTYCAKGAVRRMLQSAGFVVERLPGPPGGKREILRASKPESNQ